MQLKKYAMVVAHCDDESLFAGGLIQRFPGDWTILACVTPGPDEKERSESFHRACKVLGASSKILGSFRCLVGEEFSSFDHVVTHGALGEYGHKDHIHCHELVKEYRKPPLTCFGYLNGQHRIRLTPEEHAVKMKALQQYDYVRSMYPNSSDRIMWEALYEAIYRNGLVSNIETYDGAWPL